MESKPIQVAIADDHTLVRTAISEMLERRGMTVVYQAGDGSEMVDYIKNHSPDIILMDMNMPIMSGREATLRCREINNDIKILALSVVENELSIISMIKAGVRGYLLKDAEPEELERAIHEVLENGFYHSQFLSEKLGHVQHIPSLYSNSRHPVALSEREIMFIKEACTELTYKEIADKLNVSPRSVDGYRESVFQKLPVKTRVGLTLYAIKTGMVEL